MKLKNIQATSEKQIAKYVESIQLLQQKVQTLQQSNLNTPHMPDYNQPMNNESFISLLSSTIAQNLKQNTELHKEHYISSAKAYDGKDPKNLTTGLIMLIVYPKYQAKIILMLPFQLQLANSINT